MTAAVNSSDDAPPPGAGEVFRQVIRRPTATRDIIRDLGLHPTAAARATSWLRAHELVVETKGRSGDAGGRPTVPYAPSRRRLLIGVEIVDHGGLPAELLAVITDVSGK